MRTSGPTRRPRERAVVREVLEVDAGAGAVHVDALEARSAGCRPGPQARSRHTSGGARAGRCRCRPPRGMPRRGRRRSRGTGRLTSATSTSSITKRSAGAERIGSLASASTPKSVKPRTRRRLIRMPSGRRASTPAVEDRVPAERRVEDPRVASPAPHGDGRAAERAARVVDVDHHAADEAAAAAGVAAEAQPGACSTAFPSLAAYRRCPCASTNGRRLRYVPLASTIELRVRRESAACS